MNKPYKPTITKDKFGEKYRYLIQLPKGQGELTVLLGALLMVSGMTQGVLEKDDLKKIAELFGISKEELDEQIRYLFNTTVEMIGENFAFSIFPTILGIGSDAHHNIETVDLTDRFSTYKVKKNFWEENYEREYR